MSGHVAMLLLRRRVFVTRLRLWRTLKRPITNRSIDNRLFAMICRSPMTPPSQPAETSVNNLHYETAAQTRAGSIPVPGRLTALQDFGLRSSPGQCPSRMHVSLVVIPCPFQDDCRKRTASRMQHLHPAKLFVEIWSSLDCILVTTHKPDCSWLLMSEFHCAASTNKRKRKYSSTGDLAQTQARSTWDTDSSGDSGETII